jgi:flagellar protein FliS
MQSMRRAMTAYGQAAETLAPAKQVVMLYDGALRRIREAREAVEAGRVQDRSVALAKATAIIDALAACLDHERGGEIAANLDRIYIYVSLRLQQVNLTDDVAICDELTARLTELRTSWAQIAGGGGASVTPAATAAPAGDSSLAVTI